MGLSYGQRNSLKDETERIFDMLGNVQGNVVRETVLSVHNDIMTTSPKDTAYYMANNFVELGDSTRENPLRREKEKDDVKDGYAPNADARVKQAEKVANSHNIVKQKKVTFYNNVPYALELEAGHSKQAPDGVYIQTAYKVGGIINKIATRELKKVK